MHAESNHPLLMIAGPTACGKSALAVELALRLSGEVINVDSVQIYRELRVGSAKITVEEMKGVFHHLIDIRDPDQAYNAAEFIADSGNAIAKIRAAGKLPIVCGGTNLYITHLLHGLAELPGADPEVREELEKLPSAALYERLSDIDPVTADRLHPNDRLRVIRAIETYQQSGVPASELQKRHSYSSRVHKALIVVPCWSRDDLYARIDRRAASMIGDGLVEETRRLIEKHGEAAPPLRTLGYLQAAEFLRGGLKEEALVGEIAMYTRRYAKRQMTFWRNEPQKRGWSTRPEDFRREEGTRSQGHRPARANQRSEFHMLELTFEELVKAVRIRLGEPFPTSEVWYLDAGHCIESLAKTGG